MPGLLPAERHPLAGNRRDRYAAAAAVLLGDDAAAHRLVERLASDPQRGWAVLRAQATRLVADTTPISGLGALAQRLIADTVADREAPSGAVELAAWLSGVGRLPLDDWGVRLPDRDRAAALLHEALVCGRVRSAAAVVEQADAALRNLDALAAACVAHERDALIALLARRSYNALLDRAGGHPILTAGQWQRLLGDLREPEERQRRAASALGDPYERLRGSLREQLLRWLEAELR